MIDTKWTPKMGPNLYGLLELFQCLSIWVRTVKRHSEYEVVMKYTPPYSENSCPKSTQANSIYYE